MAAVIQIELNEINLPWVRAYGEHGELPVLNELIERHGCVETASEDVYEHVEPWIQWVTAHTGLPFAEHGVFRLGDMAGRTDLGQVWERLEGKGRRVGAISPMNARCAVSNAPFFMPDPWTPTGLRGEPWLQSLHAALRQAVQDNAAGGPALRNVPTLLAGMLRACGPGDLGELSRLAATAHRRPWRKAIFLDVFLFAVFLQQWRRHRPDFASLFVNAGAHIQHHYLFNAAVYEGGNRNPAWYVDPDADPVLEVYRAYDRMIGRLLRHAGGTRLIIATGLHQDPEPDPIYYWRPRDHAGLVCRLGVSCQAVEPRMSRDFLVRYPDPAAAETGNARLAGLRLGGFAVFSVSPHGATKAFVELAYPRDLPPGSVPVADDGSATDVDLSTEVTFVALKNGRHNGTGYLVDTGNRATSGERMPLSDVAHLAA